MNSDPRCCPRGRGDCVVSLVNLTADVPDSFSSGLGAFQREWQGRGTNTARNMWGYWGVGLINAAGMLQECWIGLLRDGLFNQGRCGPGKNHRIVIPNLACTFSVPCQHSSGTFSAVWKQGVVNVKLTSYGAAAPSDFCRWFDLF